jgi:hypothetical protein
MDLVLSLLKQLAASLTPTQFLTVILVIAVSSFVVVKTILKIVAQKSGMPIIFGSDPISDISKKVTELAEKIDLLMSKSEHEAQHEKTVLILRGMKETSDKSEEVIQLHVNDVILLKKDLESMYKSINDHITDMKHQLKMNDVHDHQSMDAVKALIARVHDMAARIEGHIAKIDEFTKAAVPEFRSYHKELSKDMSDLSRDVALVERSVQTQINTSNAVKLR